MYELMSEIGLIYRCFVICIVLIYLLLLVEKKQIK